MRRFMLDTDTCLYAIKGRPASLGERFAEFAEELCISAVTLGELFYGAENSQRRAQNIQTVEQFAARLEVLPFDARAAAHYGQIRAELKRVGRLAGVHDILIGGHARSEGLVLVTNNLREFSRMPGLVVENWAQ
jgi:tRNA(fMet)-specific endonuclease VapC